MNVGVLCRDACQYRVAVRSLFHSLLPLILCMTLRVDAQTVIEWDFSRGLHGWKGNHHVADLTQSRRGLSFTSTGVDPWIEGPAVNLQTDRLIKVTFRMQSNANSTGELFYGQNFQAGHYMRFAVNNDGDWHDYELMIRVNGPVTIRLSRPPQ
jgi:hypothetical protein